PALASFVRGERAAQHRICPEHREECGGCKLARDLFRLSVPGQIAAGVVEGGHVREDAVLVLPIGEVAKVDDVLIGAPALPLFPHERKLLRILVRKAAQQHGIDDAEDRGVCPNTERERKQRHKRHHRTLQKHPHAKLDISQHFQHLSNPSTDYTDLFLCNLRNLWIGSLATERFHWVHFCCSQCRNIAGKESDDRQQHRHCRKRDRILRRHSKQQTRNQPREGIRARQSDHQPEHNEHPTLFDDHQHHVARLRTEREPDPNLVRTLRDRVTHHAVQPDDSQHQRDCSKDRKQRRAEPRPCNRRRQVLFHRLNSKYRHVLVHRRDLFAYSGDKTAWLVARLDTNELRERHLRLRYVISRRRIST